ncbi:MAG: BatA and WFA domain-containing protein [Planctomycetaceae bacterium]|nr:BatA and WFA domain-containing protein [Planctomycetaceae bacterium]
MWPQWTNMLSPWQWAALLAVPPAIVALYFLRLKRTPLDVSSTYLWRKSIEDLHVNSLWQRLRQSLLLFLQLLLVGLLMLALWRPSWQGDQLVNDRMLLLIDTSASMSATDVKPTRLEEAKRRALEFVERMKSGDQAMVISFSDRARVEQPFTDNRKELRRRIAAIRQTAHRTSLDEALRVATGLAQVTQATAQAADQEGAAAGPVEAIVLSDGKFGDVPQLTLGNLRPTLIPIGSPLAANVAIAAFNVRPHESHQDQWQAFGRIENHGPHPAKVQAELYRQADLLDATQVDVPPGESRAVVFDLTNLATGVLELRARTGDALALDDTAWATVNPPRRARILYVTPGGDEALNLALATGRAVELADVHRQSPDFLKSADYQKQTADGRYDLVIYDRCAPAELPPANTLFVGRLPPGDAWKQQAKVDVPQIIDVERAHPLMQFLELGDVLIAEGTPLEPPPGATVLIHTNAGPMFAIAPRLNFEDAVLGFELYGDETLGTNWPARLSFPLFVLNVIEYLGGQSRDSIRGASVSPGETVRVTSDLPADRATVRLPNQSTQRLERRGNVFEFAGTDGLGIYEVSAGGRVIDRFAVNLFDSAESDIPPRTDPLKIGHVEVAPQPTQETIRREGWKYLAVAALAVLILEWYIYNRRVYL